MIVCLGWGSLVWNPQGLQILGQWESTGPRVPVEYLRQSNDGRLTLVVDREARGSSVLWARMGTTDIAEAKEDLRMREGKTKKEYIGSWQRDETSPELLPGLAEWADEIQASAVIWTALPAKFDGTNYRKPTYPEALEYLRKLDQGKREKAEEYIRRTPVQVRTPFRELFERDLGWLALADQ